MSLTVPSDLKRFLILLLSIVAFAATSHAQLTISEFLASNSNGLKDELGNEEDWVEIHHSGASTISLSGWYLTDDPGNLRKWPFPAWTLNAGNRVVVFASNRNRAPVQTTAGQDNSGTSNSPKLATNFKLTANAGGYLALTQDQAGGGVSVISVFNNYPKQVTDVSYGNSFSLTTLVTSNAPAKTLVPTIGNGGSGLGATWRGGAEPFNDSGWLSGNLGVGRAAAANMISAANLKLRLEATSAATLTSDTSGAAHPATNTSNTTIFMPNATDTAASPVLRRGAMQFAAGSSSQMTVAAHADFNTTTGTMMFWMKSAGMSGGGNEGAMLWDRRAGSGNVLVMHIDGRLFSQPAGGGSFNSVAKVNDDRWHHVAFVYNSVAGGTDTFYVDGVASGSVTHGNAWSWPAAQQIEFGRSHDGYWYKYNGLLDEVRFYGTALTAGEIASIYQGADESVDAADIGLSVAAQLPGNGGAFIRVPFSIGNPTAITSLRLTSRVNDGFLAYINGTLIDTLNAPGSPAYNSTATSTALSTRSRIVDVSVNPGTLVAGTNILAVHGLNNSTSDPNFLALHALEGISVDPAGSYLLTATPGLLNSGVRTNIGPFISNVTGSPGNLVARPPGGGGSPSLMINATVASSLRPLAAANPVQLAYCVMYNSETVVTMTPIGGGVYTASIPTTGLTAGQMLRWRVIATDNTAVASTAPAYLSTTDADQYYGTVATDGISTQLPIYHVFVPGTYTPNNTHVIDQNNVGGRASLFYDGELYDNVFIRIKGDTTRTLNKRSHRVDFNSDHQFRWAPGQKALRELNLNAEYVDPSHSRQFMSMWLHRSSGTGAPNHFPVRAQINGAFWQLAFHTETQDFELLDNMGLDPNGAMYASVGDMSGAGGEKQTRVTESSADMSSFVTAITNADLVVRERNVFDQIDIPAVVNYLAVARLTQEGDDVWANMVIHRDSDGTGEWRIIPYDTNLSWGQLYYGDYTSTHTNLLATDDTDKSHPLYGSASCYTLNYAVGRYNRFYNAIVSVPRTREMLLRRMRTLMDEYLQPPGTVNPRLEAELDAHIARITPEVTLDRNQWGWPPIGGPYGLGNDSLATAVSEIKSDYIALRRTHFFNTHTSTTNVGIANANSAGIPATAQAASFPITIAGFEYNPTDAGKQDAEWIQLTNANGFAADLSGWKIAGAVNFTFRSGTVLNPGTSLYVSPKQQAFRVRTTSPRGNESRFVVGPYSGQISARGETIELRNAAGALVTSAVTPSNPTVGQRFLRITELNYNPLPPTPGESAELPGVAASDFEWLEIQNTGATSLVVGNATFTKGLTFTFPAGYSIPAGGRVLLVGNAAAFQKRYGNVGTIAGTYSGNLSNSGEEIELTDPNGEVILDFQYEATWFPPTDGTGRTLVVRSASPNYSTYDEATHWAISGQANGTPGSGDTDFANHYDGWRWDHFSEAEIYLPSPPNPENTVNTAVVGVSADPDLDGLGNFGEYAFGRNARAADNVNLSTPGLTTVGADSYLTITFLRRHKALDVTYIVETTDNLTTNVWTPTNQLVATVTQPGGIEQVTFRDTVPQGVVPRFIRVRALK